MPKAGRSGPYAWSCVHVDVAEERVAGDPHEPHHPGHVNSVAAKCASSTDFKPPVSSV
ncbi:MAG: hypothetical protein M3R15_19915 [Acidobacteriota bacterium]|nr:hypothetical protein [Acidobacteriota bacterium]